MGKTTVEHDGSRVMKETLAMSLAAAVLAGLATWYMGGDICRAPARTAAASDIASVSFMTRDPSCSTVVLPIIGSFRLK